MENSKIDAVVYWVDGNDIEWQKKRNRYKGLDDQDFSPSRYRDWENLQFLFRGIEKFAPWINKVFFISDGQIPSWMNTEYEKLVIVDHKDYIPEKYLPTFSSRAIDLNFHRIEELSEQFIMFNDDFFLTAPVKETDFFQDGLPVDVFMEYPIMCGGENVVFSHTLTTVFNTIGKYYDRKEYKKRLRKKILSFKYGMTLFYNLFMYILPFPKFFGLLTPHYPRPYLKTAYVELWEQEEELLDQTCSHRFRDKNDLNIYTVRLWNMMKGRFVPGNILKMGHAFFIRDRDTKVLDSIRKQKYKMICINDECDEAVFEDMKEAVIKSFETILPEKSGFEK